MLREPRDRDGAAASVRGMMAETAGSGAFTFAVVLPDGGTVIGEVSLIRRGDTSGEIGYVLHPGRQGRGLATEAVPAMFRLGFDELGLHRIFGRCSARNAASARLVGRLGMRREAHLRGSRWVKGEWRDELVYAILAGEWRLTRSP
ncbi:MAG TPA: GNAT family protein [Actinophytocola sp.]|nr:GNAT family protein [Actinophytocola sp.]